MMKCPSCQTENRDGAQFCRVCGQSLKTELRCPQCGHINLQDSKFCDECGLALVEPTPEAPPLVSAISSPIPTYFAGGRYQVKKFLGEVGKKKIYLAHDTLIDRDVAVLTHTELEAYQSDSLSRLWS